MISVDLKRAALIDMISGINAKIIDATVICEHMQFVLPLIPKINLQIMKQTCFTMLLKRRDNPNCMLNSMN